MKNMMKQLVDVPKNEAKKEIMVNVITYKNGRAYGRCISYIRKDYHEQLLSEQRQECGNKLKKALSDVISPFWLRHEHLFEDVMKNVHTKLDVLIKEWKI